MLDGLGEEPLEVLCSEDYLAVFSGEDEIVRLDPDMGTLKKLDLRGVISEEEDAIFNLGRSQLRISVDLDKGPHEIKRIYDAALPIVEVINTLDLKQK